MRNRNARRPTRSTGARIGRPPRADAGNWEKFYVCLKLDVAAFVRAESRESGRSLSSIIGDMTSVGVAETLRRREGSRLVDSVEQPL